MFSCHFATNAEEHENFHLGEFGDQICLSYGHFC